MIVIYRVKPVIKRIVACYVIGKLSDSVSRKLRTDKHFNACFNIFKLSENVIALLRYGILFLNIVMVGQGYHFKAAFFCSSDNVGGYHLGLCAG